jgi:hypothetical protein
VSRDLLRLILLALALAAGACPGAAFAEPTPVANGGDAHAALLALDCANVSAITVANVLAHEPAPRVMLVSGSLPLVTMDPFARFLAAMGYPAERLRDPHDGALTQSGYQDSLRLAGVVAWHYEHDGMAPILIGHSRGGMLVVRTLHELAGAFGDAVPVWDPVRDEPLARTAIVDPYTHETRPVVGGVTVEYAAAIATGRLPRLLQGQWAMVQRLHVIPDTVREFAGFSIDGDLIAGELFGHEPYAAAGHAHVRNVRLPATTLHVDAPRVDHLAADASMRAWIDAYRPGRDAAPPSGDTTNLLQAAGVWYGVKSAWCRAAQLRARESMHRVSAVAAPS